MLNKNFRLSIINQISPKLSITWAILVKYLLIQLRISWPAGGCEVRANVVFHQRRDFLLELIR
jgi:hypothetical protein